MEEEKELELKTYKVGELSLTQDVLSLKDSKAVLKLLKDLDWQGVADGGTKGADLTRELMETDRFENILDICIKGMPEGKKINDVIDLTLAFAMVSDFFEFNANLIMIAMALSRNSNASKMPEDQESEKKKLPPTEKTPVPSIPKEGSDSVKESSMPSQKEKLTG